MRIEGLRQAPFNCTMMGALRGALAHYGSDVSAAYLYGASGHAFVMNIHKQLCPSGPYCWERAPVHGLLRNVGLQVEPLGFFWKDGGAGDRSELEARLRAAVDAGEPCYLVNMEFQLITGYDETGFLTAQPWPGHDFPQAHLTFGTWAEMGDEIHVDFSVVHACAPADRASAVRDSLRYAVDLWRHSTAHTSADYGIGPNAYANWMQAVKDGHGDSHGNWWNGTVWAECRDGAADYLREVADVFPDPVEATAIGDDYGAICRRLGECSSKELPADDKLGRLAEARGIEARCIDRMESVLAVWA